MQAEKSFDTGELTLKYLDSETQGSPLVLLHGLTSNKSAWASVQPRLSKNWHVYAPDLRGHGSSGRAPDNNYRNADYARDVIAFLKMIGQPAVLVGHSLGAMTALVTAALYPAGVRALVLLDPPLFTYTDGVRQHPESTHWFRLVANVKRDDPPYETVIERLRAFLPDVSDESLAGTAGYISGVAAGTVQAALRDDLWQGVDLHGALQSITCPTLLIHGDWDRGAAMREQDVAFFRANRSSAVVIRLPGADHGLAMQEQPGLVLGVIDDFLKKL